MRVCGDLHKISQRFKYFELVSTYWTIEKDIYA